MTANLPVVDPLKVHAPVLIVRGEYDGIATEEDLVSIFPEAAQRRPPTGDVARHGAFLDDGRQSPPVLVRDAGLS